MEGDEFGIALTRATFNLVPIDGNGIPDLIRWGMFEDKEGVRKIAAFKASMIEAQFAHDAGRDLITESDAVVRTEGAQSGPLQQAYEWDGQSFIAVDPATQAWFRFS